MNTTTITNLSETLTETQVDGSLGLWVIIHTGSTILTATFVADNGDAVIFGEDGITVEGSSDGDVAVDAAFDDFTLSVTIDGLTLEIRDFVERVGTV